MMTSNEAALKLTVRMHGGFHSDLVVQTECGRLIYPAWSSLYCTQSQRLDAAKIVETITSFSYEDIISLALMLIDPKRAMAGGRSIHTLPSKAEVLLSLDLWPYFDLDSACDGPSTDE
jgi:hypothetical protein